MSPRRAAAAVVAVFTLAGCGAAGTSTTSSVAPRPVSPAGASSNGSARQISESAAVSTQVVDELRAAERPLERQFPAVHGRSLRQVASAAHASTQLTAATGVYTPGLDRYAFGLSDSAGRFVYAPSAVYIARSPDAPAEGPFLAPADPVAVAPQFRSQQTDPDGVRAVYNALLPLRRAGVYAVLVLTRTGRGLIGSSSQIAIAPSSPIPAVGERPPAIATDTLASAHGKISLLTTRMPPDDMHGVSLDRVLGKRPIALLFSTPELCVSRVCGPVTDIMVELEHEFGSRMVFIHEEVYVDDDPSKGLRPQLKAFHLQTEPWLFTIDAKGLVAARLDGAFGVNEARAALQSALR